MSAAILIPNQFHVRKPLHAITQNLILHFGPAREANGLMTAFMNSIEAIADDHRVLVANMEASISRVFSGSTFNVIVYAPNDEGGLPIGEIRLETSTNSAGTHPYEYISRVIPYIPLWNFLKGSPEMSFDEMLQGMLRFSPDDDTTTAMVCALNFVGMDIPHNYDEPVYQIGIVDLADSEVVIRVMLEKSKNEFAYIKMPLDTIAFGASKTQAKVRSVSTFGSEYKFQIGFHINPVGFFL